MHVKSHMCDDYVDIPAMRLGAGRLQPVFNDVPELDDAGGAKTLLQLHLICFCFCFRNSLHLSHCETGRPFFLISNRGRSVWWQDEERWPLIQDALVGGVGNKMK